MNIKKDGEYISFQMEGIMAFTWRQWRQP